MNSITRSLLIIVVVLLVPMLPFLLFGPQIEGWMEQWKEKPLSVPATIGLMILLLASDIVLPVPSSLISTLGGWQLGWLVSTIATCIGMTLGAALGFALARRFGRPWAERLSSVEELARMQHLSERYGALVLVLCRGVPIFAEASVLLMGVHRMPWRRFLLPVVASNFGIGLAYSAFGDYAEQNEWLPLALGVAVALPVLLAMFAQLLR